MKRTFLTTICAGLLLGGYAQSKIDLQSQVTLKEELNFKIPRYNPQTRSIGKGNANPQRTIGMIEFDGKEALGTLAKNDVSVLRVKGNIAIVSMPLNGVEQIAELKCVRRIQLSRPVAQKMDRVREAVGVNKIHQGVGLPQAYTGKGVVTGIVDGGIDPNNINFLKPDGTTRYGYLSRLYTSSAGKDGYIWESYFPKAQLPEIAKHRKSMDNVFAIEDFETDNRGQFHGTHTTGIMAGGYKGKATVAVTKDNKTSKNVEMPNPYYGIATESELVASCGDLRDVYIALGIDDVYQYARLSGPQAKPCVINLSLGSNLGSHDSTSVMNRFLTGCTDSAIICVAAGNEADYPVALNKTFTKTDNKLQTFIRPMAAGKQTIGKKDYYNFRNGQVYAYSSDATEFKMQVVVFNEERGRIATRITVEPSPTGKLTMYSSGGEYAEEGAITSNSVFNQAFEGYVMVGGTKDPETGRYYAIARFLTSDNQTSNKTGKYKLGILVEGKDGKRVDLYGDAQFVYFDDYDGVYNDANGSGIWSKGSRNGTINDMACAAGIITVGSYNVSDHWASMDGWVYGYNNNEFPQGKSSRFSSFGTLLDGRNLPLVCAPGAVVISSVNTYTVEDPKNGYAPVNLQAKHTVNGKSYYWHQTLGTSMATPVVAGSIALWLEADPTLKAADVADIIRKTAVVDNDVKEGDPVQWGAGKFDAYAGLKEVLRRKAGSTGINTAEADNKTIITPAGPRRFNVFRAGEKQLEVRVFTMAGQLAHTLSAVGDETTIDANAWNKGVYLIQVNGKSAKKIIIY